MSKKIRIILIVCLLLLGTSVTIWAEGKYQWIEVYFDTVQVKVNGDYLPLSENSIIYDGSIYIPLRNLSQMLGADVSYDKNDRSVNLHFINSSRYQNIHSLNTKITYQYMVIQQNLIIEQLSSLLEMEDFAGMKEVLARYENLRKLAMDMQDETLAAIFDKLRLSGEVMRNGLESNNLEHYYLAWSMFDQNVIDLNEYLESKLDK